MKTYKTEQWLRIIYLYVRIRNMGQNLSESYTFTNEAQRFTRRLL